MSKFIVALTLPEFGSTPNSPSANFYKYYLRNHWLKVLNSSGVQKDVVLDRPLDGFVADNPPCLPITANDTVLTAFEKFQCIMDNLAIITGSMKAATPWTDKHTSGNNDQYQVGTIVYYMNSVYKCIASNDSIVPTNPLYWQYLGVADGYYSQEQADWNATSGSSYIRNKPTIPPAPVQPDWNQTDTGELDFIKNKPTNFGFDPVACNAKLIANQLDSCSAPLEIQKDYASQVRLQGLNIGKGPSLLSTNSVLGFETLKNTITGGIDNTAVGYRSLYNNTTGLQNTGLGYYALANNTTGNYNTTIGYTAGSTVTTANHNIAIGFASFAEGTIGTASQNVSIGSYAFRIGQGTQCIAIGYSAISNTNGGTATASATGTIAIGAFSLGSLTTGENNTVIGYMSGREITNTNNNTAVGSQALRKTTAYENNGFGSGAGYNITTGYYNIAIGADSMSAYTGTVNCTGNSNTAIGKYTLAQNSSGNNNIAIGVNSSRNTSTGGANIAIGVATLYNNTTGISNTIIGDAAGYNLTGSGNVFIGSGAGTNQTSVNNRILFDTRDRGSSANENAHAPVIVDTATNADDQKVTLNAVLKLKPLATAPFVGSEEDGMLYYDGGTNKLRLRAAGAWVDLN